MGIFRRARRESIWNGELRVCQLVETGRRWMRLVASLVALGLISGAAVAAAPDVPNIDGCLGRLDPELDIGYDRIAARCPELVKQLEQGDWAPWLPGGWKDPGN